MRTPFASGRGLRQQLTTGWHGNSRHTHSLHTFIGWNVDFGRCFFKQIKFLVRLQPLCNWQQEGAISRAMLVRLRDKRRTKCRLTRAGRKKRFYFFALLVFPPSTDVFPTSKTRPFKNAFFSFAGCLRKVKYFLLFVFSLKRRFFFCQIFFFKSNPVPNQWEKSRKFTHPCLARLFCFSGQPIRQPSRQTTKEMFSELRAGRASQPNRILVEAGGFFDGDIFVIAEKLCFACFLCFLLGGPLFLPNFLSSQS